MTSFTNDFSAMNALKSLTGMGKGKVAAILPDTTSSTRYVEFDAPYLKKAAAAAGLPSGDMTVENALGSDSTFVTDAESAITNGATVLLIDPEDSGTGVTVQRYAKAHGVAVVDYDRLTLGAPAGTADYVSFNNVHVGQLIGSGFVQCVNAWHVAKPNVVVMAGAVTDNNATLFAQGYNGVLASYFQSGKYTLAARPAGTWMPPVALTEFEGAYTAHHGINSAVIPNDENGAPIISFLAHGVKPKTFPTTGQDGDSDRSHPDISSPATSAERSTSRSSWRRRPRWLLAIYLPGPGQDHAPGRSLLERQDRGPDDARVGALDRSWFADVGHRRRTSNDTVIKDNLTPRSASSASAGKYGGGLAEGRPHIGLTEGSHCAGSR